MALEFICSKIILQGKRINIPEGAEYYIRKSRTISKNKGRIPRINFFKANPTPTYKMKKLPENVRYISFKIECNRFHINYGEPSFYDLNGNVLKDG